MVTLNVRAELLESLNWRNNTMYNNLDTNNRVYLIFCDISIYRRWVNESICAESFFSNLEKLKSSLAELSEIDFPYDSPVPSKQLEEIIQNEQKLIQDFLSRSWISAISETKKLKTEKGKEKRISRFFDEISIYEDKFSKETLKMIEEAKSSVPDFNLFKNKKSENDLLFLNATQKNLAEHISNIDNLINTNNTFSWLYNNKLSYYKIIGNDLPDDAFIDIIKLLLLKYDYKKASRFLRIKYNFETQYGIEIYVTANTMLHSKTRIKELSRIFDYYSITTHSSPCPICEANAGKVFEFTEAEIGINYPPLCRHNCSNALPFNK